MTTFNPGDHVTYRPHSGAPAETGDVTSVNDRYVFVRFDGDTHAKACAASVLEAS